MENNPPKKGSFFKKFLAIFFLIVIVILVGLYFIFGIEYSNGARAGVLIKISQKGVILKTYEGELNVGGMNTVPNTAQVNQIWHFSVRDPKVAEQLMNSGGRKVSLHYKEVMKSLPWQGETNYFVYKVDVIE